MTDRRISQIELARMTNFNISTLHRVFRGEAWPDIVTLAGVEQALGITVWPTWGDTTIRDQEVRISQLEEQVRTLRSRARKKAASAPAARKKVAAARTRSRR